MVSGSLSLPSPGFFSPFPHGTCSLSVAGSYSALDRGRPGFRQGSSCPALLRHRARKSAAFRLRGYHALRPRFPARSAMRRFSQNFPGHPRAALQPRSWRFGLLPVRSPLLGESLLISVPVLLRWFTSHSVALPACLLRPPSACLTACGLPHSEIRGSRDVCSSPRPIAACRVLPRRPAPPGIRHGPMIAWPYPCSRPQGPRQGHSPFHLFLPSLLPVKDLILRCLQNAGHRIISYVGRDRVELSTPALSERCSNQLSYCSRLIYIKLDGK